MPGNAFEPLLSVLGKFCFVGSDFGFWVYSKADFIQIPARLNLIWTSPLVRGGGWGVNGDGDGLWGVHQGSESQHTINL